VLEGASGMLAHAFNLDLPSNRISFTRFREGAKSPVGLCLQSLEWKKDLTKRGALGVGMSMATEAKLG